MSVVSAIRSTAGASRLSLLHLRIERGSFAVAFAVVAGTTFVFAAMPGKFAGFADDALRRDVATAAPAVRDLAATEVGRIPATPGKPLAAASERGQRVLASLPAPLPALVTGQQTVVETPRLAISGGLPPAPGVDRYLTVRALTNVEQHVALVRGRLPHASTATAQATTRGGRKLRVPVIEIALSAATAKALHAEVGDRIAAPPDTGEVAGFVPPDPLARSVPGAREPTVVTRVVGIVRVRDPGNPFWFGTPLLAEPVVAQTPDLQHRYVFAYALASRSAYADLLRATGPVPLRYHWRYPTAAARFADGDAGSIRAAAARLEANNRLAGPLATQAQTGLGKLIDGYLADRSQAETLLAIAAIGLLACCTAAIGLLAALSAQRRRFALELLRIRGGSPAQVVGGRLAEGALLAVPAAAVGLAAAVAVTDAGELAFAGWLTLTVALATIAAFAAGAFALVRRPLESSPRDEVVLPRLSPRRLVLEGLVVVAAAIGVVLLRRRGGEPSAPTAPP
jgi:putative ABC transport system permease protein